MLQELSLYSHPQKADDLFQDRLALRRLIPVDVVDRHPNTPPDLVQLPRLAGSVCDFLDVLKELDYGFGVD